MMVHHWAAARTTDDVSGSVTVMSVRGAVIQVRGEVPEEMLLAYWCEVPLVRSDAVSAMCCFTVFGLCVGLCGRRCRQDKLGEGRKSIFSMLVPLVALHH